MERLSPHWRVLAPDLLGAGRSAAWPVAAGARLQHELDALAPVLLSLGDRFHVVGHSYGAALAMAIAQAAPQRVASAVLFEPTTFPLLNRPGPGTRPRRALPRRPPPPLPRSTEANSPPRPGNSSTTGWVPAAGRPCPWRDAGRWPSRCGRSCSEPKPSSPSPGRRPAFRA